MMSRINSWMCGTLAAVASVAVLALGPASQAYADNGGRGMVYTESNAVNGNEILVFNRDAHGGLHPFWHFATGGIGTGEGLGNQGALALTEDGRWLLAVNAGSNDVSVFSVYGSWLFLSDRMSSGGQMPVSVTTAKGLVYVLNAGSEDISGFKLSHGGKLKPIDNSTRPLSGTGTAPAQISFNADGDVLAVTEKATQTISTYTLNDDGTPDVQAAFLTSSPTPFGFAFGKHDQLIVSEAVGGAADASVLSVYDLGGDGVVSALDPSVATTETAACWVANTEDGHFTYTTNAGSNSITGFAVNRDGTLAILNADGVTGVTGAKPLDIALSRGDRFLYTLNAGDGTVSAFAVQSDGSLTPLTGVGGIPAGASGLIAR